MPLIFPRFVADRGDNVGRYLHDRGHRHALIEEMWRAYSSLAGAENRKAFVRTMRGVIDPGGQTVSARDRLYLAGRVPTMIVWGDDDRIIPVEHGIRAHEEIEGSRLEVLEGVGHFPHAEDPARFVEVLADFVATTQPGPTADNLHDLLKAANS